MELIFSHATIRMYVVVDAIRVLRATPQVLRYHHSSGGYATKGHLWLVQPPPYSSSCYMYLLRVMYV